MGRHKRGFNAEARKVVKGRLVDENEVKKLRAQVLLGGGDGDAAEGDSNALVLPAKKRVFKKDKEVVGEGRFLSKKKRRRLEKIVEQKKKKAERGELLERLKEVQIAPEALEKMASISAVQTKGLKRQFAEDEWRERLEKEGKEETEDFERVAMQTLLKNPVKKQKLSKMIPRKDAQLQERDDVLGFEESSEEEEEDIGNEEEVEDKDLEEVQDKEEELQDPTVTSEKPKALQTEATENEEKKIPQVTGPSCHAMPIPTASTSHISVSRDPSVQQDREKLPILAEEQVIMEAINENPVVVIAGETGSGKTTQVPQFLYEAGYARGGKLIAVTEPRRVAAMAMSRRVGLELGAPELASYQIRFEGNVTDTTRIKFMTDGVLLREMAKDFRLSKYSVVVVDEAHERSVFTDILIGNLSRIVPMRHRDEVNGPLRLVVMSATLRVEDFTQNERLFRMPPPCVRVDSRQFEVTCHFQRNTPEDYLAAALKKTCKIHRELPEGGILVFVTGQQEVNQLVRKLRKLFPVKKTATDERDSEEEEESVGKALTNATKKSRKKKFAQGAVSREDIVPKVNLDNYRVLPLDDTESDALRCMDEDDDLEGDNLKDVEDELLHAGLRDRLHPMWTLPLYSLLSTEKQNRIFKGAPAGHRLCVVATNVAETSLTIPGIKYVVDTGKMKTKFYDRLTGVSTFLVSWTSKAGAAQRAGRAGRQGPGHCYRLYSSEVFKNSFPEHAQPEIAQRPVDDLMLQMKAMRIDNVRNFPFPTPPDATQLLVAENKLLALGAIARLKKTSVKERKINPPIITPLGRSMAAFPLAPCFAKMLALSAQDPLLLGHTVTLVSALTVQEVLQEAPVGVSPDVANTGQDYKTVAQIRAEWAGRGESALLGDPMVLMEAVYRSERYKGSLAEFCVKYSLRLKAMVEIRRLRRQLTNEVNAVVPDAKLTLDPSDRWAHDENAADRQRRFRLLRQILLSGMVNQVARKVDVETEFKDPKERKAHRLAYRCSRLAEPVFIHSKSVFAHRPKLPEWVVFQEVFETDRMFLRGVTAIEPEWLPVLAKAKCNFLPPMEDPEPWFDSEKGEVMCERRGTFGEQAWPLPTMKLPYPVDTPKVFQLFARFLVEGDVCEDLKVFTEGLLRPSSLFTRTEMVRGEVLTKFIRRLADEDVYSLETLKHAFVRDKDFLKQEFKTLVPKARHGEVDVSWPPMNLE